ncbi:prepilin-type N-terminal cleavage/methylation domain-containing protein [Methylotuvimicrobium sp.]|uniref:prepilin-type N-terminal cleavage/methylation domain-containing protein n=1 Tax=Methylotuvimicrobium sp. TaxID=2822413 RepID=UPI003D64D944
MKTQTLTNRAAGQSGFTLLELLVVVTLLAILATGALVAYDGADEKAQSSRAANTIGALDQGVRAYRAVTGAYPNQWDNLADPVTDGQAAVGGDFIPEKLQDILGSAQLVGVINDTTVGVDIEDYFENNFGMDEIQHVFGDGVGINGPVEPNRAHNEGTNPPSATGGAVETEFGDFLATGNLANGDPAYISILASKAYDREAATPTPMDCKVNGVDISTAWTGDTNIAAVDRPRIINSINDALSTERCNLVLAIGFGGDAAQSTVDSSAGVVQAPTYTSKNVNPANQYARYIGLFLLAKGPKTDTADGIDVTRASNLVAKDFLARPRLLGFIDTEGNTIDMNIAEATRD